MRQLSIHKRPCPHKAKARQGVADLWVLRCVGVNNFNVCLHCRQTLKLLTPTTQFGYGRLRRSGGITVQARWTRCCAPDLAVARSAPQEPPRSVGPSKSYPRLAVATHVTHTRCLFVDRLCATMYDTPSASACSARLTEIVMRFVLRPHWRFLPTLDAPAIK